MPAPPRTPGRDDVVATIGGVIDGMRRIEERIARLGEDGDRLAALLGAVAERLLALATRASDAARAGDPQARALCGLVATAADTAGAFAADALHTLERSATILRTQPGALRPSVPPDCPH